MKKILSLILLALPLLVSAQLTISNDDLKRDPNTRRYLYKGELFTGTSIEYYSGDNLKGERTFKDGCKTYYKWYQYSTEHLKQEGAYSIEKIARDQYTIYNERMSGKWITYNKDGSPKSSVTYTNGQRSPTEYY